MNRNSLSGSIYVDITTRARYLGLCPDRRDRMVWMDEPLFNEVIQHMDAAIADGVITTQHWANRLDAFIDQVRVELFKAPKGCRSLYVAIATSRSTKIPFHPHRLSAQAVTERYLDKHVLALLLAKPTRLAA